LYPVRSYRVFVREENFNVYYPCNRDTYFFIFMINLKKNTAIFLGFRIRSNKDLSFILKLSTRGGTIIINSTL